MNNEPNFSFPYIGSLKDIRTELGQKKVNIKVAIAEASSQDQATATRAQHILNTEWILEPERSSLNAETVDLVSQLAEFSDTDQKRLIKKMGYLQLTEGCNGNCSFCLFGKKKGVDAKYSYDSIKNFFHKYSDIIPDKPMLYLNSDPMDYKDGDHNFTDIYKAWREIKPNRGLLFSTAIPKGSQYDFIDFVKYHFKEQLLKEDGYHQGSVISISLSKHNFSRVENTFDIIFEDLLNEGYSSETIQTYVNNVVQVRKQYLDSNIKKVGLLINLHDDIKDISTPACEDGIVITPKNIIGMINTVPTIYEPSGQKDIVIDQNNLDKIPFQTKYGDNHGGVSSVGSLSWENIKKRYTMMGVATNDKGEEISLPNKIDDIVLKLGRETASIGNLIKDFTQITNLVDLNEEIRKYVKVATEVFRERQIHTQNQISVAREYCDDSILLTEESEKIEFYILLTDTYLKEMDFLADQVENNQPLDVIAEIAKTFRTIGKNNVSELPNIISSFLNTNKP